MTSTITKPSVLKALQRLQVESHTFTPLEICRAMKLRRSKDRIHKITVLLYELASAGRVYIHHERLTSHQSTIRFSTYVPPPLWLQFWYLAMHVAAACVPPLPKRPATRSRTAKTKTPPRSRSKSLGKEVN